MDSPYTPPPSPPKNPAAQQFVKQRDGVAKEPDSARFDEPLISLRRPRIAWFASAGELLEEGAYQAKGTREKLPRPEPAQLMKRRRVRRQENEYDADDDFHARTS